VRCQSTKILLTFTEVRATLWLTIVNGVFSLFSAFLRGLMAVATALQIFATRVEAAKKCAH
jgi:hypothetical protein